MIVVQENRFLGWCSFSPWGHIVLFELLIAVPLFVVLLVVLKVMASLTAQQALYLAIACAGVGAMIGLLTWFAVTRPLIRRKP